MSAPLLATFMATALATSCLAEVIRVPQDHDTIGAAIAASSPGDVIEISAGLYTEPVVVGVADLTLVGKGKVTIEPGVNSGIHVTADRVVLRRLHVRLAGIHGIVLDDVDGCRVEKCRVTIPDAFGIQVVGGTGHEIVKNRIDGLSTGMEVDGSKHVLRENTIVGEPVGLRILGSNHVLEGNVFEKCSDSVIVDATACLLLDNVLKDVGGSAFQVVGASNSLIGNTVTSSEETGIARGDDNGVTQDNRLLRCLQAISVGGDDNVVRDNRCERSTRGIGLSVFADRCVIHENDIERSFQFGMVVQGTQCLVSSNRVRLSGLEDILDGGTDNIYIGNVGALSF